jgi:hypothetical protein
VKKPVYREPQPIGREEADRLLRDGHPAEAAEALLRLVLHDADGEWLEARCVALLSDVRVDVRGMAALCLGHVARLHRRSSPKAVSQLRELMNDPDASVAGRASDALDDIQGLPA